MADFIQGLARQAGIAPAEDGGPGSEGQGSSGSEEQAQGRAGVSLKPYERKAGNWIRAYLEFTKESESPENYHLWCALSAIASATRRNVWIDQGLYVLFPNLYIAFVGPPGRTAKSTALWLARQIITQAGPGVKMGPEACSREQLIRELAESKFDNQCALTIHCSEFSDLVDTSGILMIQFLTSIYDGNYVGKAGWKYNTKHQGKDTVFNPFLNIIFGTTPSYLAESMPDSIIGHGFTARTIVVYEERERHTNSLPDPHDSALAQALVSDLRHISNLRGKFEWGGALTDRTNRAGRRLTEAEVAYDDFYQSLYKTENLPQDHRLEGFHWRKKTHVLKVAMLLSMAERDDLIITAQDIEVAVQFMHDLEPQMARAFSAVGKFEHASTLERIGNQVRLKGGMPMEEVYRNNYFAGDAQRLESLVNTLVKSGVIRQDMRGGKVWLMPSNALPPWALKPKDLSGNLPAVAPVLSLPGLDSAPQSASTD